MKWFKRYAISCLIAMFLLAIFDGYSRPGKDPRVGSLVVMAVGWPVVAAIAVGGAIGAVASGTHAGQSL